MSDSTEIKKTGHLFSKSRLLSGIQCPKRLFLEVHFPKLAEQNDAADTRIKTGHQVAKVARTLYPDGVMVEYQDDLSRAVKKTRSLLAQEAREPIFEGAFTSSDVLVRSDIFLKVRNGYKLIEVKSSTKVEDYHLWDCAIQSWVIEDAGYPLENVIIAHIDNSFVYQGNDDYDGLFHQEDVMDSIQGYMAEIPDRIVKLKKVLDSDEPEIGTGAHCKNPFECPFREYCSPSANLPEFPVSCLPRGGKIVKELLEEGIIDIRDIPEGRLKSDVHKRIRRVTVRNSPELNKDAGQSLRRLGYPRYYLDFETIQFAVPIWKGTRPYQQLPFQWSCHIEPKPGELRHKEFLDTTGQSPLTDFIGELLGCLSQNGPIFVYSHFERTILGQLAEMYTNQAQKIQKVIDRLVDLLPLAREHYYHPKMKGSWSIKAVLPTIAPDLDYASIEEVQDGTDAQMAYMEAIDPETDEIRKRELARQMLEYCKLDTLAIVRLVKFFQEG